jgi:hypothetical protein
MRKIDEESWEAKYRSLLSFIDEFKRFPTKLEQGFESLGNWCLMQRQDYKNGELNEERIKKLDEIDFLWNPFEDLWDSKYKLLLQFMDEFKRFPTGQERGYELLSHWCLNQRQNYRKGEMIQERLQKLEDIGFVWNLLEETWEQMYQALQEFIKVYGRFPLYLETFDTPQGIALWRWCSVQRREYDKGEMGQDRIQKLEDIGFIWAPLEDAWNKNYQLLRIFMEDYDRIPIEGEKGFELLARWCGNQRSQHTKGELELERMQKLEDIGFIWVPLEDAWNQNYQLLCQFINNNHGRFPMQHEEGFESLGSWCSYQRQNYKKRKLSTDRVQKLESIAFPWVVLKNSEKEFTQYYKLLVNFIEENGRIPRDNEAVNGIKLGIWVVSI